MNSQKVRFEDGSVASGKTMAAWLGLMLLVMVALAVAVVPAYLMRPFRTQTPAEVVLSCALKSWAPIIAIGATLFAGWLLVLIWRSRPGKVRRGLGILMYSPAILAAWFAQQNHFEWMFHPLRQPEFALVDSADFIQDSDMVIAVEIGGEAVAYPVRQIAYHHIVHDLVGGVPIVATY